MDYQLLKTAIADVIKANGNQEITGNLLQSVLLTMVETLGEGYRFAGVATQATVPPNSDALLFYIAEGAGSYPDFGLSVSTGEVAIFFKPVGYGAWVKQSAGTTVGGFVNADPSIPQFNSLPPVPTNKQSSYVWAFRTYAGEILYTLYESQNGGAWTAIWNTRIVVTAADLADISHRHIPSMISQAAVTAAIQKQIRSAMPVLTLNFPNNTPQNVSGDIYFFPLSFPDDDALAWLMEGGSNYYPDNSTLIIKWQYGDFVYKWHLVSYNACKTIGSENYLLHFGGYGDRNGSSLDVDIYNVQRDGDGDIINFDFDITFGEI